MSKAIWLLVNHKAHQSQYKLAIAQLHVHESNSDVSDDDIASASLRPHIPDGMPVQHVHSPTSRTEYIALEKITVDQDQERQQRALLLERLKKLHFYLEVFEAAYESLTDVEKSIIEAHYIQNLSFSAILACPPPNCNLTGRNALSRKCKAAVQKMDESLRNMLVFIPEGDESLVPQKFRGHQSDH